MKKILAVAAFAFAFSVNGYAQEAAAPAESPAPAAQKCCKKDKKCPRKCAKEGKCPEKCGQPCSKALSSREESSRYTYWSEVNVPTSQKYVYFGNTTQTCLDPCTGGFEFF